MLFLVCALILSASLAVYFSTTGAGEGSRAAALERQRGTSAHARVLTPVGDGSVDTSRHEDGGSRATGASSIHISVKTTAKYHDKRLVVMMLTWMRTVPVS